MTLTVIALDKPSQDFGAVFTKNAFPGAPVIIGRERLNEDRLGAIVVNNKISNVCAPDGIGTAESICAATAKLLGMKPTEILPSSTGIIGWKLPLEEILMALPAAIESLSSDTLLPAADGIVTTDLYAKVRRAEVGTGSIVGVAKGAGMIEPNMATMLVYILTDIEVPRDQLRASLTRAVQKSFNRISVDSDTSTSDTVAIASSGKVALESFSEFEAALQTVCRDLAEDVVRNGEGVRHVMRVEVTEAPDEALAHRLGKAIVNAPLFKCAIAGNDANVGRLVQVIGKELGVAGSGVDVSGMSLRLGGVEIFSNGVFRIDPGKEATLTKYLTDAQLYASAPPHEGIFTPPVDFPPHERCVRIEVIVGSGNESATVMGADLTHEYVSENADYRS